jgi:hypothetical protein
MNNAIITEKSSTQVRQEIFSLFQKILSETTDNKLEDIRENSLIYNELNLTEYDVQRLIKEISTHLEIDTDSISQAVTDNDDITTVGDILDLIVDEKELG